jgi:hypothetical protein
MNVAVKVSGQPVSLWRLKETVPPAYSAHSPLFKPLLGAPKGHRRGEVRPFSVPPRTPDRAVSKPRPGIRLGGLGGRAERLRPGRPRIVRSQGSRRRSGPVRSSAARQRVVPARWVLIRRPPVPVGGGNERPCSGATRAPKGRHSAPPVVALLGCPEGRRTPARTDGRSARAWARLVEPGGVGPVVLVRRPPGPVEGVLGVRGQRSSLTSVRKASASVPCSMISSFRVTISSARASYSVRRARPEGGARARPGPDAR